MPNEHTIAENLQRLVDAKTAIANAITAKGGTVGANDGLEEFAAAIAGIPTSEFEIIRGTPKSEDVSKYNSHSVFAMKYSNIIFYFGYFNLNQALIYPTFTFEDDLIPRFSNAKYGAYYFKNDLQACRAYVTTDDTTAYVHSLRMKSMDKNNFVYENSFIFVF